MARLSTGDELAPHSDEDFYGDAIQRFHIDLNFIYSIM